MSQRIAIATTYGEFVDTHFGRARQFTIIDVDDTGCRLVEKRQVEPACVDFDHSQERFDAILSALSDCESIFVSRIGFGAARYLESKGFKVFETPYLIEDVVTKLVAGESPEEL